MIFPLPLGSVEGRCSKSTRHSPARREHWRGKVASAGEAGESKKTVILATRAKRSSGTVICMFNTYDINFYTPRERRRESGCKILLYKFIHSLSTFVLSFRHSKGTGVG
jgi:hypothetical protein